MPTIDQARTIESMWQAGRPVSHISRVTKLSRAETRRYIHDHTDDCPPRMQTVFNTTERKFIVVAWNNGATIDEIAGALNITRASVTRFAGANRDLCPTKDVVNRRLSAAKKAKAEAEKAEREARKQPHKLSEEMIDRIIEAHKRGLSSYQIARECGVGSATANRYTREWEREQEKV